MRDVLRTGTLFLGFVLLTTALSFATVSGQGIPVGEALHKVTKVFGTQFMYEKAVVKGKMTTYDVDEIKGKKIEDVLKGILYPEDLVFLYIKNNYYAIAPKGRMARSMRRANRVSDNNSTGEVITDSNINKLNVPPVLQSRVDIAGFVRDESGQPLERASVLVKGTTKGTYTDTKGRFVLDHVKDNGVLVVSYIGYASREVAIAGRSVFSIKLEHSNVLDETIVIGYGTKKRAFNTDAVSAINSEQITAMPATNLSQVFAGRLPGVLSRTTTGAPGDEDATLLIRTTDQGQRPLLVIDGVPSTYVGLDAIDPSSVASISILKDNAATAVYGARAANGVIVVTTKRGKLGKPQFSYSGNFTWSSPTKRVKILDGYDFAVANNQYNENSGLGVLYSPKQLDTIKNNLAPYRFANTDWVGLLIGNPSLVQDHNLNVSGGGEAIHYFISGSFSDEGGMFPSNYYKRYTFLSNLDIKLSHQFKAKLGLSYRNSYKHLPGGTSPYNAMSAAASISPLVAPYMPNGTFGGTAEGANPLADISPEAGYKYTSNNYFSGNGRITWTAPFIKGLSAYVNLSIQKYFSRSKYYTAPVPLFNPDPSSPTGYKQVGGKGKPSVTDYMRDGTSYTVDAALRYQKDFEKHHMEALALYTQSERRYNSNSDRRRDLVAPGLDIIDMGSSINESTSGTRTQSGRAGFVGRLDYNYDQRLLAEFSFRYDGSSKFAPGHRWGFFPGGSLGWIISKESFFSSLNHTVSFLKLRGSVGLAGDDNIGDNTYYYTYRIVNTGYYPGNGYVFGGDFEPTFVLDNSTLPNEDITWAKNLQYNFGFNAMFWGEKLGITFDIYQKDRYDILRSKTYNLPATFGIKGPIQNFAKKRDRGFELGLSSKLELSEDWSLNLIANITSVKTRYIDWGTQGLPDYQRYEGHPTNALIGYKTIGIFQSQKEIEDWNVDQDNRGNETLKPGDIKFADLDGDGKISSMDQMWFDNYGFPPINLGFGFTVKYKALSLNAFFNGAMGGYMQYGIYNYQWQYVYDHSWRPDNPEAIYPRIANSNNNERTSDISLTKSDYVRLRNVRLGYSLPKKWLDILEIKNIDIYAQASNLFTLTSVLAGIDPEAPTLGDSGPNGGFYPIQRRIGFGVKIKF